MNNLKYRNNKNANNQIINLKEVVKKITENERKKLLKSTN